MKLLTITRVLGLSFLLFATSGAWAQSLSQWNVNNGNPSLTPSLTAPGTTWFNALNWLNYNPANGVGVNVAINQDFNPGRAVGDVVQTATMLASAGTSAQAPVTLNFIPVDGTLGVSDGTFFWSQGRGSSSTAFIVTYNSGNNQVTVTYNPAITGNRTLTITYGTTTVRPFVDMVGVIERAGQTNGSTLSFSKVLAQIPSPAALAVTDGTFWYNLTTQTGNNANVTATYDAGTRTVTVNYSSIAFAPAGRNIFVAYMPNNMVGTNTVVVNTIVSGEPIRFTRQFTTAPTLGSSFTITDTSFTATSNGAGVFTSTTGANNTVTYTDATRTAVVSYKTLTALNSIGTGKTIVANYTPVSPTAQNVTLGNLIIGDISGGERMDVRLGSLTFDNNDQQAQLNKIIGGADEIASPIVLNDTLALAVRTGGDAVSNNSFYLSGAMSGTGGLIKLESGNVVIGGNNSYTGSTIIRNTGGTTFLKSTGTAIPSSDVVLGTSTRDGHSSMVLQYGVNTTLGTATTVNTNQIADNATIFFDAASGRNSYIRMFGTGETVAGIQDSTSNGVIENTEGEGGVSANSMLTLNSNNDYFYNGYFRNKSSGGSSGTIGLVKLGTGTQTIGGGNISYTGPTTVGGGTLRLLNITNGAGNLPYNPQSGSAHNSATTPRFDSLVTNNANLELAATTGWTYGLPISGTGTLTKTGASTVSLTGASTYTGATIINEGKLILTSGVRSLEKNSVNDFVTAADNNGTLAGAQRQKATYGDGTLLATSAININGVGIPVGIGSQAALTIQNAQSRTYKAPGVAADGPDTVVTYNNTNRVSDTAPVNSDGGFIEFTHSYVDTLAKVNYSELLGTLNLTGGKTQVSTSQAPDAATSTLSFNAITRTAPGATVNFTGNDLGDNTRNRIDVVNAPTLVNGIIGGWATILTTNTANGNSIDVNFATFDAAKDSIRALQTYATTGDVDTGTATSNILLTGNDTLTANRNINSLKLPAGRTLTLRGGTNNLSRVLTVESGGIIAMGGTSTITSGTLTAGAGGGYELDVYTHLDRTLNVSSIIADNTGNAVKLVKTGGGRLQLNANNSYSGGTIINEGNIEITNDSALGLSPSITVDNFLTMNGGVLSGGSVPPGGSLSITFEDKQGITLGTGGGGFAGDNGLTFRVESKVTGPGGIIMNPLFNIEGGSSGGVLELVGANDFQGGLTVNIGEVVLGGYVGGVKAGTNTFKGAITVNAGTLSIKNSAAVPASKPVVNLNGGRFQLFDDASIGALSSSGSGSVITSSSTLATGYVLKPTTLTINQDINTTYSGDIANSNINFLDGTAPALSIDKRGKGTLTLTSTTSTYDGVTKISEGVLVVSAVGLKGRGQQTPTSIGTGVYNPAVLDGTGVLLDSQKSAGNLVIMDGAALSTVGEFQLITDRPFTIGVGQQGASLLANSASIGNVVAWRQNKLYVHGTNTWTGGYDDIQFTTPNQNALLNLGGRNQGGNQFGLDLHDNGTGKLSLQKTGDGQWVMGEWGKQTGELVTTPSRNDFTGRTTIYVGTLAIAQDHVLGAAGGESVNLVGGNLDLINVDYTTNEALSMAGGRLRTFIGNSAWTGNLSIDVGSAIETGTGSSLRLRGNISGKGGITKVGFGTLTLEGSNSFTGGFSVQEGTLRLDYSNNAGSKLFDTGGFALGGGRSGGTLDIVGGTGVTPIVEVVAALNIGLGQNRITRSDPASTTVVLLNALENGRVAQGAALDIGADNIVRTDRLNDPAGGLLGTWLTVNKRDWATNATNAADGSIVAMNTYTSDNWNGAATNTSVTLAQNTINSSVTNTLRFNDALDTVLTLTGVNSIRSDGILQTPEVGTNNNVITGGTISIQENGFGGNLMIHQNNTSGSLTIDSALTNASLPSAVTGDIYVGSLPNKMTITPASNAAKLVPGMLVTGSNIEPNTTISTIDYNTGDILLNQGRTAETNIPLVINGVGGFTGDTLVQGVLNRVRVRTGNLASLANGQTISGGIIPGGSTITSVGTDPVNLDYRIITISQNMNVPPVFSGLTITPIQSVVGQMYIFAQTNRLRISPVSGLTNLYAGMAVTGSQIEPNTVISSIDFFNGDIFLNQGRTAEVGVAITINGNGGFTGDTMVAGVQNRVRVTGSSASLLAIVVGNSITGGSIPASTTVSAISLDNATTPTVATLTISQNVPVPAVVSNYVLNMSSRNGLAKYGDGTLVLGGESTYTGATYITGGKVNVKKLTNGGVASPIGAASNAANNIVLSGGILGYIGDSVTTDRGFQINEIGGVEVARMGSVATFNGNLSGGVGGAAGVLEKTGQGTLSIARIEGNITTPTIPGTGGATNIGGMTVKSGTLQLTYNNPNSNDNTNRFSASNAALTMAGGRLVLKGMDNVDQPNTAFGNPTENRVQQFQGALTIDAGASEIRVTAGKDTTTTLDLQNPNDPRDIVRNAGGTVHLVEDPNGGTANMTIAVPSASAASVLPWATYLDTSGLSNRRGVNDFAAIEPNDNGVISADSKNLYTTRTDVSQWERDAVITEGGNLPFSGSTDDFMRIYALRFFTSVNGTVDITNKLTLGGGAILVGGEVANKQKTIQGGILTSSFDSGRAGIDNPNVKFDGFFEQNIRQYDLIIHNYNPNRAFVINSTIEDNRSRGLVDNQGTVDQGDDVDFYEPVNLVQTGVGTTMLSGTNTYTGRTFITGGVLRLDSAGALPGGIGATGGTSNVTLKGGMLGINGDFLRPLGTTASGIQFTGSGGFAAYGGDHDVNLGGAGDEVSWGVGGFVPGGESLLLNNVDADGMVRFVNPIDLGSGYRQIGVGDSSAAIDAELAGTIKGNGGIIAKVGYGTLRMAASNTYTGGTDLAQGRLIMQGSQTSPISVSAVDATAIGDAVTLQLDGATIAAAVTVGNKNSQGISILKSTNNSTFSGAVNLQRDTFVDVASGKSVTLSSTVSGSGRITVNEGGTVAFNSSNSFGTSGGASGAAVNGGIVVRNGNISVGTSSGLGNANIELGDLVRTVSGMQVDRSSNGRSMLQSEGVFDPTGNGVPGSVNGYGAFMYQNQSELVIDGKTYGKNDVGKTFLIDGEADHPERNGVYVLVYDTGIKANDASDDIISLTRVPSLNDAREQRYGIRVTVQNGSAAGKSFFLATDVPNPRPTPDLINREVISTAVHWKEDNLNPNIGLLASAAGLNVANTIDINGTNGLGNTTIGGAAGLTSGSTTFSGNISLQNPNTAPQDPDLPTVSIPVQTTSVLRLTSETNTGHGIEFSGVIAEATGSRLAVNKIGAGTVTLSGLNTYDGDTTVTAGTLLVNGGNLFDVANGSGTGFGNVTVSNFGSVLGGLGTIAGNTTLTDGALLSPGDPLADGGVGPLNFGGNLTMGAGSLGEFHLSSEFAYDKVVVVGQLTMDPTALLSVFLDYVPAAALDFQLLDWGTLSAAGSLADRLDLPALASAAFFWDTSSFGTFGILRYAERLVDTLPPVHFAAKEGRIHEDGGTFKLAVELDWEPTSAVSVPLQFSGTAVQGIDYTISPNPVTFAAGDRSQTVTITVNDDAAAEGTEKATISLGTPTGALLGTPTNFNLTIADTDNGYAAGDKWDLRNPLPTNEKITGVSFIGTNYVAVGTKGTLLSSADGIAWLRTVNVSSNALRAVASSGAIAVAVGDGGQILTSTDGTQWTIRSASGNKDLKSVYWNGAVFIAVGAGGSAYISTDGEVWNYVATPATAELHDVAASPTKQIAVGLAGALISSVDSGLSWSLETSGVATALRGVAHNGTDLFVAVGDGGVIRTSADGTTWTARTSGTSSDLKSVIWDGSQFYAAGNGGVLRTSANGITWSAGTSTVTTDLDTVAKVNTLWFSGGEAGMIITSANGATWARTTSNPVQNIYGTTVAGSIVVAVGDQGTILTSPDGIAWTGQTSPIGTRLNAVHGSATNIVAVGHAGAAVNSTNGTTWTSVPTGSAQNLYGVTLLGSRFCAVGDAGTIFTSDNGTTWTDRSSGAGTAENLRAITATDSKFVAVGANGTVITSPDGIVWTAQSLGSTATVHEITWTGSSLVAVGAGGSIFTSLDGISWTLAPVSTGSDLNGVAGVGAEVIAVGGNGVALVSTNSGSTWSKRETGTSQSFRSLSVVSSTQRYIGVGVNGTIMTTDTVLKPTPKVFFTLASQTVSEAAGLVNIQVNVSPAATSLVTVPFTVNISSTAKSPTDYTIVTTPLKFAPGETTKNIPVTVKIDTFLEGTENLIINLGTPTGGATATVAPTQHTLTITDEYVLPTITPVTSSAFVIAGNPFTVRATATGSNPLKIQWMKGTANLGTPVTVTSGVQASYTVASALVTSGGKYGAKVINPLKAAGVAATAGAEIVVVERFASTQLKLGKENTAVTLTANAGGTGLAYRWYRDNVEIPLTPTTEFSGMNTKTLTIKKMTTGMEGLYKCRVTSTAVAGGEFSTTFHVLKAAIPQITGAPSSLTLPNGVVGTPYNAPVPFFNDMEGRFTPASWTAAPLPAGLTINSAGVITGTPIVAITAPTTYANIKIAATNVAGKSVVATTSITISPIHANAIGSFVGLVDRTGAGSLTAGTLGVGARFDLTTMTNSTFSGKITVGATAYSFNGGKLNTTVQATPTGTITVPRAGKTALVVNFAIDTVNNLLTGTVSDVTPTSAALNGWRLVWKTTNPSPNPATDRFGRHNFVATIPVSLEGDDTPQGASIPQGDSFGAATVALNGTVTLVYKTSENSLPATASAPLSPTGKFLLYKALYTATAPGSVMGTPTIANTAGVHEVTGTLTWNKATQLPTVKLYQAGFGPITLDVAGGLYNPPTVVGTDVFLGAKVAAGVNVAATFFDSSSLSLSATALTNPNQGGIRINSLASYVAPVPNPASLTMSLVAGTGEFSGSFILKDSAGASRTVLYYGQMIPDTSTPLSIKDGVGAGYFVLNGLTTALPQKSGRVTLTPLP